MMTSKAVKFVLNFSWTLVASSSTGSSFTVSSTVSSLACSFLSFFSFLSLASCLLIAFACATAGRPGIFLHGSLALAPVSAGDLSVLGGGEAVLGDGFSGVISLRGLQYNGSTRLCLVCTVGDRHNQIVYAYLNRTHIKMIKNNHSMETILPTLFPDVYIKNL